MAKSIQLSNVPDDLHRKLEARAAAAGMSLADYVLQEVRLSAEQPTHEEIRERLRSLPPVELPETSAETIRLGRGGW